MIGGRAETLPPFIFHPLLIFWANMLTFFHPNDLTIIFMRKVPSYSVSHCYMEELVHNIINKRMFVDHACKIELH